MKNVKLNKVIEETNREENGTSVVVCVQRMESDGMSVLLTTVFIVEACKESEAKQPR